MATPKDPESENKFLSKKERELADSTPRPKYVKPIAFVWIGLSLLMILCAPLTVEEVTNVIRERATPDLIRKNPERFQKQSVWIAQTEGLEFWDLYCLVTVKYWLWYVHVLYYTALIFLTYKWEV